MHSAQHQVTTDTSEVLKEFQAASVTSLPTSVCRSAKPWQNHAVQEMFAKLAPLQTKLDEQRLGFRKPEAEATEFSWTSSD